MVLKLSNNASSTLVSSITNVATSLTVQTADATLFPSPTGGDWFPVTLVDASGNIEIMRCTARAAGVLTVARAQEGTTAIAFSSGSRVDVRLTAGALTGELANKQDADANTAKLNVDQSWSGSQRAAMTPASISSGNITLLLANGNDFGPVSMTSNATIPNFSDIASFVGQKGSIVGAQDASGGRTLSYGSQFVPIGAAAAPAIPAGANAMWRVDYHVVSSTRVDFSVKSVGV